MHLNFFKILCYPNKKAFLCDSATSGFYLFNNNKNLLFVCGLFLQYVCNYCAHLSIYLYRLHGILINLKKEKPNKVKAFSLHSWAFFSWLILVPMMILKWRVRVINGAKSRDCISWQLHRISSIKIELKIWIWVGFWENSYFPASLKF